MGKGGGVRGYRYLFGLHMGICRGPVDALVAIKVADKLAWPVDKIEEFQDITYFDNGGGNVNMLLGPVVTTLTAAPPPKETSGSIYIDSPTLFGGDDREGGIQGTCDVMMGEDTQGINSRLSAMVGGGISAFRGMFTLFFDGLVCSNNPYPKPWKFRVRRAVKGWDGDVLLPEKALIFMQVVQPLEPGGDPVGLPVHAMNPAHIIYECLTNRDWGRGLDRGLIDTASFEYVAETLCCEGFGLCLKWQREDDVMTFVQVVIDHIGAVLYPSRKTGLLILKLLRNDYTVEDLPLFTMSTGLLSVQEDDSTSGDTLVNELVVTYTDPISGDEKQTRVHNIGSVQASGAIFSQSVSYPGIPTHELATRVAQRDLRAGGTPLRRLKLTFDRRAWDMEPGSVFRISIPERGITSMVMRAGRLEDGAEGGSSLLVTAVEDIFGMPNTAIAEYLPPVAGPSRTPIKAEVQRMMEAGHIDLLRFGTDEQLASVTPDDTFVALLGKRPTPFAIDFNVVTAPEGAGLALKNIGYWTATGTLAADLTILGKEITLADVDNVAKIKALDGALVGDEIVQIVNFDEETGVLEVLRGCADTVPTAHEEGARIWFYFRGLGTDDTPYAEGETVRGRIQTRTFSGLLALTAADEMEIETVGRQNRPYPPGNVLVDGNPLSAGLSAKPPFAIEWASRNRLTQADTLLGHEGVSVTPEANTTYTLRVLADDGSGDVLRTVVGLIITSWSYTKEMWFADGAPNAVILELWSVRLGVESWQKYEIPVELVPTAGWGTGWGYNWSGGSSKPQIAEITFTGTFAEGVLISIYNNGALFGAYTVVSGDIDLDGVAANFAAEVNGNGGFVLTESAGVIEITGPDNLDHDFTFFFSAAAEPQIVSYQPAAYANPGTSRVINTFVNVPGEVGGPYPIPAGKYFGVSVYRAGILIDEWAYTTDDVRSFSYVANAFRSFLMTTGRPLPSSGYSVTADPGVFLKFTGPIGVDDYSVNLYTSSPYAGAVAIEFPGSPPLLADQPQIVEYEIIGTTREGAQYIITLAGVDFTYTVLAGDDATDVALGLKLLIDADAAYVATNSGLSVEITGVTPGVPFTFSSRSVAPFQANVTITQAAEVG